MSIRGFLSASVDIASLVYFRIVFGIIMLWDMLLYDSRRIEWWIAPKFHFTYFGFGWIHPLPGDGLFVLVYALRILAVFVAVGLFYRVSCALFFVGFTYIFLLDQADHLNHAYLTCLLSFLMIFIPAHRQFSLDSRFRPAIKSDAAPAWCLWILRFQVAVVYIYGAFAKFSPDWLRGEPMRSWLAARAHYAIVGPLFTQEPTVYFFAYGGLLFDLLVVPLLAWRKTRPFAFAAAVFFHLMNNWLFDIAIFPWMMIATTALYFPPDWPRRLVRKDTLERELQHESAGVHASACILLALYAATQLLFPLRQFLYPGDANWTEEGQLFAWRMKLRNKYGSAQFVMTDPATKKSWMANPADYLSPWQIMRMATRPDMLLQFSHFLAAGTHVEVRVRATASLNGRKPQLLIDPEIDLAAQPRSLAPSTWILPLTEPLEPAETVLDSQGDLRTQMSMAQCAIVITRLIDEQQRRIDAIDRTLVNDFAIDPHGNYQFDAEHLILYALVSKSATGTVAGLTSAKDVGARFDKREHSRLADKQQGDRFLALAAEKSKANRILRALKAMQLEKTGNHAISDAVIP